MTQDFESFNEQDDEWLSELETRAIDLENELFDWRESRARELAEARARQRAESAYRRDAAPGSAPAAFHRGPSDRAPVDRALVDRGPVDRGPVDRGPVDRGPVDLGAADTSPAVDTGLPSAVHTAARPAARPANGQARPQSAEERTRALIDHGRRSVDRVRVSRGRKITIVTATLLVLVTVLVMVVFRKGASWPPSVAVVQGEISSACQNPNVASEPGQVNFACGKTTSQILWVFALMTSADNPSYTDAKTGREGLEPITPTQGGEVAWSLDLHHPYNPYNPIDSLTVAARAINNIIGGATLTNAKGNPAVQSGLEGNPANCATYTGSSAMISRAGFPDLCAQPVTSLAGQAALVADVYQEWVVGATPAAAKNVSVLFENANNPGNPQVQAILSTLPGAS
jgi:hypothetical protein